MTLTTETTTANTVQQPADISALKERLKATWEAGDYDYFSRYMEQSAVEFLDRLRIPAGSSLLDVACGSGQLALIAARRGLKVSDLQARRGQESVEA